MTHRDGARGRSALALADSIHVRAAAGLHSSAARASTCCVSGSFLVEAFEMAQRVLSAAVALVCFGGLSSATHQRQADRTAPLIGDVGSGALVGADGKLADRLATQINQHGPTVFSSSC